MVLTVKDLAYRRSPGLPPVLHGIDLQLDARQILCLFKRRQMIARLLLMCFSWCSSWGHAAGARLGRPYRATHGC